MDQNKSKGMAVALVVAIIAVVVGLGVWAMNRDDNNSANETTNNSQNSEQSQAPAEQKDIVALAAGTEQLSTLVTAVKAADLVATLQGDGPFTVFAPDNAAFAKIPAETLNSLLLPENKSALANILTYHVVAGKVMSSDLKNGQVVTTVQGGTLTVEIADGKVMLVDAKGGKSMVTTADVTASNGVVHIIDTVVMPAN
jgi:uncharacterized surface protein with fasciclin (FAS1) repeats